MTTLDLAIVAIVAISALLAFARGIVRSLIGLVAWVVGFIAALTLAPSVAAAFASGADASVLPYAIAFIAIFGGIGTVWGPTLAAFVIIPMTELLRAYLSGRIAIGLASTLQDGGLLAYLKYYAAGGGGQIDLLIYGLIIILIARFQPRGMLGFFRRID